MATRLSCIALLITALVGCQQVNPQTLPSVSFSSPTVIKPPAPVVAAAPAPQLPKSSPPVIAAARPAAHVEVPAGWIPNTEPRPWRYIVIHHSATEFGNAQIIDGWHRAKGWDELGYHFVIDNGNGAPDGQIEIGPRWIKQKWGAHTKTADNRYNDFGIGICLVGNFDIDHPSAAQLHSVEKLVAYLMKTYHIPPERVIGHGDAKPTDCPGKFMNVAEVRGAAARMLAESGDLPDGQKIAASNELLQDSK